MLAGEFEHEDSTGAKGKMSAGDVQWMKTGGGIIHSEMPAMTEGKLHGFQLWVNMPAKLKMNKPEYIYIDSKQMQVHKDSDKKIKTIAGKFRNAEGPVKGHNVEPIYFDIEIEKEKEFNFDLPSTHNSFIYLIEGEIKESLYKKAGSKKPVLRKGSQAIGKPEPLNAFTLYEMYFRDRRKKENSSVKSTGRRCFISRKRNRLRWLLQSRRLPKWEKMQESRI